VSYYGEVLRIDPEDPHARLGIETAVELSGRDLEVLLTARDADPDSPWIRYRLAVALYGADLYSEAEREYREAILLDRNHAEAHVGLGILFGMSGRYEETEEVLSRAVELDLRLLLNCCYIWIMDELVIGCQEGNPVCPRRGDDHLVCRIAMKLPRQLG
jgi:Flp pilus assembly protein TadD